MVSALLALGFIGLVDRGIEWLASEDQSNEAFSGSPWIFVTLVVAGFIIGLIYKLVAGTREVNVFEGLEVGKVDTLSVPGGLGVAVTSLVSGASLGPEVPTGMLAGGMATWVSEHQGWHDDERKVAVQSSVGSAWGGLFTTPFVPSLMALELNHRQSPAAWPLVMIQALSSVTGFAIFYLAGGWAEVIRFLSLPEYSFDLVDLAYAGLVGVVGAAGAMLFVVLHRRLEALARTLATRPVLRSTIGGALLGVLGVALPLTLYNGAEGSRPSPPKPPSSA